MTTMNILTPAHSLEILALDATRWTTPLRVAAVQVAAAQGPVALVDSHRGAAHALRVATLAVQALCERDDDRARAWQVASARLDDAIEIASEIPVCPTLWEVACEAGRVAYDMVALHERAARRAEDAIGN